jgi:uncharacterized protein YecA (UPF0149 family)
MFSTLIRKAKQVGTAILTAVGVKVKKQSRELRTTSCKDIFSQIRKLCGTPSRQLKHIPRPGRNQPCRCGSGLKYKKCHWLADERAIC